MAKIGSPKEVIQQFMKGYDDSERFEEAQLGEKIVATSDLTKRYISVDRGVVKQSMASISMSTPKRFLALLEKAGGKTTLSRIIAGIIEPTSGEINIKIGKNGSI